MTVFFRYLLQYSINLITLVMNLAYPPINSYINDLFENQCLPMQEIKNDNYFFKLNMKNKLHPHKHQTNIHTSTEALKWLFFLPRMRKMKGKIKPSQIILCFSPMQYINKIFKGN